MYQLNNVYVKRNGKLILKKLTFSIPKDKFTSIIGVSGSGKTTLLHSLAALIPLDSGNIAPKIETDQVAIVMQDHGLFPWKTVEKNIKLARINEQADEALYKKIISDLKLKDLVTRYPHQLSGGQSQRVAIARALYKRPQLILMDEPTASLDEINSLNFLKLLKSIQKMYQMTIVYVTHHLQEAIEMSDQVIVLSNGQVKQILNQRELQKESSYQYLHQQLLKDVEDILDD